MFALIYGVVVVVLAMILLFLGHKMWVIGTVMVGAFCIGLGASEVWGPHYNKPLEPTPVNSGDTLYVAPQHGYRGVALTVGRDSLNNLVINVHQFNAKHSIAPSLK